MKKRLIAILLVLCCLCNLVLPVGTRAAKESYYIPCYDHYEEYMNNTFWPYNEERLYLIVLDAYSSYDELLNKASGLLGEDLSTERCMEILANMVNLMNYNMADAIAKQASIDTTMTLLDYVTDATDIATDAATSDAVKKASDALMDGISTTIGVLNSIEELAVRTIEDLELVMQLEADYSMQYDFLSAVYQYSDIPEMKEAANKLLVSNEKIMARKLEMFNSGLINTAEFLGGDIFLDVVAEQILKEPDFLDSEAGILLGVLSGVRKLNKYAEVAFNVTIFLGDLAFGVHDIYNRYSEMVAMRDIRNALLEKVKKNPVSNEKDYEQLEDNISLLRMSLYVDARGEYCAFKLTTEDGKMANLIFNCNTKEIEEKYNQSLSILGNTSSNFDTMYIEAPLNTDEPVIDAFSDYILDTNTHRGLRCYHIPEIYIYEGNYDAVNEIIYQELYDILDEGVYAYPEWPSAFGMGYTWGRKNDVLSIAVAVPTEAEVTEYYVYNVSVLFGNMLDDSDTIAESGFTEEEFYTAVYNGLKNYWDENGANMTDSEGINGRNETLSDQNVRSAIPWINADGKLCSVATVSWPYGGGGFYLLLDMDGNVVEADFDCGVSHADIPAEEQYPEQTEPELKEIKINQEVLQGTWHIDDNYTMDYNDVSMMDLFGSGYKYGNEMQFGSNSEFSYWVGIGNGGDGSYTLAEKSVSADIVSYEDGGKEKVELKAISNDGVVRLAQEMYDYIIFWIKD